MSVQANRSPLEVPREPGVYRVSQGVRPRASSFTSLLQELVIRDFKGRYRRSILGPGWAIVQPVVYMAVFLLIRGVLDIPSDGSPYIIFSYCGLVPWSFFANGLTRSAASLYGGAGILKKSSVQREVFPLAAVMSGLVDFAIAATILAGMLAWFQISIGWSMFWVPVLVLVVIILALGIGLGIAAIGTFRRDILFAVQFLMQFWLLATPIVYPLGEVPAKWRDLYALNPMTGIIEAFRSVILHNRQPDLELLGISLLVTAAVWVIAWPVFRYVSSYFADVL